MSDADDAPHAQPTRQGHPRPPATGLAPRKPSVRRVLAAQVVAWHNRHPLAKRISRRDLGGYGVVTLPFSPAPAEEGGPARFAMFDDLSLVPGLSRQKVIALALGHGWARRPGRSEWPLRAVPVAAGWDATQSQPVHLLSVAIKRGRKKPALRVLVGRGAKTAGGDSVVGRRVLSRPRMALAALALLAPLVLAGWGLTAAWQRWAPTRATAPSLATGPADGRATPPASARTGPPVATARGSVGTTPPSAAMVPGVPQVAGPSGAPDDILPPPEQRGPRAGPSVGTGVPLDGPPDRAAAPSSYRLIGPPIRDPAELKARATALQAALASMGQTGARMRMDVVGTPEGDALSIGPLGDRTEADKVARRLAAHGFALKVVEQ